MSNSVLNPVKSTDPENDTPIAWELAIRRVTDAKREDEVPVSGDLIALGVETAARAMILSKMPTGGENAKKMLAELFASDSPEFIKARINSLSAFREHYVDLGKNTDLSILNKALNGLDKGAVIDRSEKEIFGKSLALVHTLLTLTEKRGDFEEKPRVEDTGDALVLNAAIADLVEKNPDRYKAILELITNRWVNTTDRVLEMLDVSDANSMMDGAL
jgi:hypothetical protein